MTRYLNPKEKEIYPEWLQKQEERRAELAEERKNKEILATAPSEKEITAEPETADYEYHLGDTVYMGADEYEILSVDDERVMLYDTQFPLFQKEMDRAEFERKVQENPMNDHLKVKELPPEKELVADQNTTPIEDKDYYFHYPSIGEFEAIYYNPNANAGGQFVVQHIPYELIAEAKANSDSPDSFYEYIDSKAYTELIDVGTQEFEDYLEAYAEPEPDYIGRTEETMQALLAQADRVLKSDNKDVSYSKIKAENGNAIVLYQVGDFFELYGNDATYMSDTFALAPHQ